MVIAYFGWRDPLKLKYMVQIVNVWALDGGATWDLEWWYWDLEWRYHGPQIAAVGTSNDSASVFKIETRCLKLSQTAAVSSTLSLFVLICSVVSFL